MSTWSGRAVGAVTWLCVVSVGVVLVWFVISRVGAGIVNQTGAVTPPYTGSALHAGSEPSGTSTSDRQATWQGKPGVVTAVCRGTEIALVGAQPEQGVVVRVLDRGPDQLVVGFGGGDEGPVAVVGRCGDGRPAFTVSHAAPEGGPSSDDSSGSPDGPVDDGSDSGDAPGDGAGDG
jgi:hypothetical protein